MIWVGTLAAALFRIVLGVVRVVVRHLLNRINASRAGRGVPPMDAVTELHAKVLIGIGFAFLALVMVFVISPSRPATADTPSTVGRYTPQATATPTPTPTPTPAPTITPVAPSGEPAPVDVPDVDVDRPHVNLPDGSLTGGYCAHKWWC
jgi:hypothetical protein